jgi:hypothetical protein
MIRYALVCDRDHGFEAWFSTSDAYDDQAAGGLVECPLCASRIVRKQIMSPAVAGASKRDTVPPQGDGPSQAVMMEAMGRLRQHVEDTFDYVGDSFAKEARDIHEGRSEERGIYGEASPKEIESLNRDGVKVAPLPPPPPKKSALN